MWFSKRNGNVEWGHNFVLIFFLEHRVLNLMGSSKFYLERIFDVFETQILRILSLFAILWTLVIFILKILR